MAQIPEKKEKKPKEEKKKEKRPFLGKIEKNHCRIGIVGLPNIGKSSFFNTLSTKQVPAENYPFCTIDPAQTQVAVPDKRFDHLVAEYKPQKSVNAVLEIWDIAGLVKGAHEGRGLGNEFLGNIQAVDAIFHVVRAFKDKKIEHVEGDINPCRDLEIIANELRAKDLSVITKKYDNMEKSVKRSNNKQEKDELIVLTKIISALKEGKDVQYVDGWTARDIEYIRQYNLFTAKPVVFLVNVSQENWLQGQNKWIQEINEWVDKNFYGSVVLPFSATFEKFLADMDNDQKREDYCKENKTKSALPKIIKAGYDALSLIHFFTAGEDEVKCWTIREGTKAPQAGGVIHSDFETGFICAEIMAYKDFKKFGSEAECKSNGKYRQQGKDYSIEDGDIILFKFNRPNAAAKKK